MVSSFEVRRRLRRGRSSEPLVVVRPEKEVLGAPRGFRVADKHVNLRQQPGLAHSTGSAVPEAAGGGIAGGLGELCKTVVDICRSCRLRSAPNPASVASLNVLEEFNIYVECDIVLYKKYARLIQDLYTTYLSHI